MPGGSDHQISTAAWRLLLCRLGFHAWDEGDGSLTTCDRCGKVLRRV